MASYNTYDFDPDTPFIPLKCCCENSPNQSVDLEAIKDVIDDSLDERIKHINCHINCATTSIINEIKDSNKEICLCNMATKKDITQAVNNINKHIDDKFDEVDFIKQFDNLNNQLKEIKND